jgi:CubicO group peptidase (beta-lactamase class C family)
MHPPYTEESNVIGGALPMKKIAILLLFIFTLHAIPVHAAEKGESAKLQQINQYLKKEMKAAHIPGLSLGIVKGNEVVHLQGLGQEGTITPQTPFILGSTTKAFTALAVMKLVEAGKIDLEAPVKRYLPAINLTSKITVRNLLTQTSGLSKAPVDQRESWEVNHPHIGKTFEYSNENYRLLGKIVTAVTNRPYREYVEEQIFTPLQMNHSYTSQTLAEENGLAPGYRTWFGFNLPNKLPFQKEYLPVGYLISSAEDMSHFLIAQMDEGSFQNQAVVSKSSIDQMHQPHVKAPIMGEGSYYGMGWFNSPINGIPTYRHSGEVPNYHSTMIIMPKEKYGIVLLANINNSIVTSGMIEHMAEGVVNILADKKPDHISKFSYYQTYMIMDGVIFIILVLLFFHIKSMTKWRMTAPAGFLRRWVLTMLVNFALPIGLITLLPSILGFNLSFLYDFVPDATSVLIITSISLLVVGCIKMYKLLASLNRNRKGRHQAV